MREMVHASPAAIGMLAALALVLGVVVFGVRRMWRDAAASARGRPRERRRLRR
jgi:hypothetical protein